MLDHLIAALATQLHLLSASISVELLGGEWHCVTYCRRPPACPPARPQVVPQLFSRRENNDDRSPDVLRRLPAVTRSFDAVWPLLLLNATS